MGMVNSATLKHRELKHRELWERFAEQDAHKYIMTDLPANAPDMFWTSGEATVRDELLPVLKTVSFQTDCCLEIGCGIGRLLLPLSKVFDRAIGVDISEGMIVRARESARHRGITNAQFARIGEPCDLARFFSAEIGRVTFIYSLLVFQHIPDFRVIQAYMTVIAQLLKPGGIAYLQFDTRQESVSYRIKTMLPDFLLPRFWRRGVRRIRRKPCDIEASFAGSGLRILSQESTQSADHRYLLGRADGETS